jgi:hypothetical protein
MSFTISWGKKDAKDTKMDAQRTQLRGKKDAKRNSNDEKQSYIGQKKYWKRCKEDLRGNKRYANEMLHQCKIGHMMMEK